MSNNKQSSVEWLINELINLGYIHAPSFGHKIIDDKIEQAKAMHNEEVKNFYISGYLDNGYYEGAEEDASKLWEETYESNT